MEQNKFINTLLFNGAKVLIGIEDGTYISKVAKETHLTKASCNIATHHFEANGIITREKQGRQVILNLTDKGRYIQNNLLRILEHIY